MVFIGIIALVFFIPLAFNVKMADTFDLPKAMLFRIVVTVMVGAWLVKMIEGNEFKIGNPQLSPRGLTTGHLPLTLPVIAFFVVSIVATLHSVNPHTSFWGLYKFYFWGLSSIIGYVLLYFLVISNLKQEQVTKIFATILIGSGLVALYGITQFLGVDLTKWIFSPKTRIWSTLGNPNYLGAYVIMVIPLALSCLILEKRNVIRVLLVLLLAALFANLLATLSRGAWVGFLGAILTWALLIGRKTLLENKKSLLLVLGILALICGIFSIRPVLHKASPGVAKANSTATKFKSLRESAVVERASSIVDIGEAGIVARISGWKSTLQMVKDYPALGTGLDTYMLVFPQYKTVKYVRASGKNMTPPYAHNEFLQVASTMGLIGLGAYLWLWIAFFIKGVRIWQGTRSFENLAGSKAQGYNRAKDTISPRFLVSGMMGAVVGLLIQNQFGFSVLTTSIMFWLFMGVTLVLESGLKDNISKVKGKKYPHINRATHQPLLGIVKWLLYCIVVVVGFFAIAAILKPYQADIHYKRGLGYAQAESWDGAIFQFQEALALNPKANLYRIALANMYKEKANLIEPTGTRKAWLNKTIAIFKENIKLEPLDPYNYNNLGVAYMWKAQFLGDRTIDLAIDSFQKAVEVDPNFVSALHNLGEVYAFRGLFEKALTFYLKALNILPNDIAVNFSRGCVYAHMGLRNKAVKQWEKVLEINPNHEGAKRRLAMIMANAGDKHIGH